MKLREAFSLAVLIPAMCLPLYAQGTTETDEPTEQVKVPDGPAAAVLAGADKALKEIKSLQYDFVFSATTSMPMPEFKFSGTTRFIRVTNLYDSMLRINAEMKLPQEALPQDMQDMQDMEGMDTVSIEMVSDGVTANALDSMQKLHVYAPSQGDGKMLLDQAGFLFMQEFLADDPFDAELKGTLTLEDPQEVNEVPCDVVYVVYDDDPADEEADEELEEEMFGGKGSSNTARWYFGRDDHLPRKVERISGDENMQQTMTYTLNKLDTKVNLSKDDFKVETPEGYTKQEFKMPEMVEDPELIAVGADAPKWELKDPDGKVIKLEDLKGKIVLLDFWATWCGPCKQAMPGVQKLHEHFKGDKRVLIFGINTWEEDPAKAVKYMKDKEYTYGLLLEGDDVAEAYGVSGIPTFYVIGPDGKVLFNEVGANPEAEKILTELIKKELKKLDK